VLYSEFADQAALKAYGDHPAHLEVRTGPLPRNPNGKIDRKALASNFLNLFQYPTL